MQGVIGRITLIIRNFNTSHSVQHRSSVEKNGNDIEEWNNIINIVYLINI